MTYTSDPGQRARRGHTSQSLTANASASLNAVGLGFNRTTFGPRNGSATCDNTRAHSEGLSCRTMAASTTSAGVTSGMSGTPSSPFSESGKLGHDVVTNPFFLDELSTGHSRQGRKSRNFNWWPLVGLIVLLAPWLLLGVGVGAFR